MTDSTTLRPSGAGPSFRSALSWSYVMTGGRLAVTMAVSLILARLLGPEAFGTIAMANVLVFFVELFVRQGIVAAIVQRPGLTPRHLDTAFVMTAVTVAVLVPALMGASGWWARLNALPQLQLVIVGLSPGLAFKGLGLVAEAKIRREMDFRALALRTNSAVVTGGAVGITAALLGAGLWALVAQQVVTAAIELVAIWTLSDWRPTLRFDRGCARELFGFSAQSGLAAIGVFVNTRSDALLIGLFFGPIPVGLYRIAVRLTDVALELTSRALQAVMLPELSRFAEDPAGLARRTLDMIRVGSLLALPALGVLAAVSEPLLGLLGDRWTPAVGALQVLCLLAAVQATSMLLGPILQAADRPGLLATITWGSAVVNAASFVLAGLLLTGRGVESQVLWLAVTRVVVFAPVMLAATLPLLHRVIGLRPGAVLGAIGPTAGASLVGYGSAYLAHHLPALSSASALVQLPVLGLVSGMVILVLLYAFDPTARRVLRLIVARPGLRGVAGDTAGPQQEAVLPGAMVRGSPGSATPTGD